MNIAGVPILSSSRNFVCDNSTHKRNINTFNVWLPQKKHLCIREFSQRQDVLMNNRVCMSLLIVMAQNIT